jgi:hypothetical protein
MANTGTNRPDLAGQQFSDPEGKVYIMNPEGILQFIPDPDTYMNLFGEWRDIQPNDMSSFVIGADITVQAILVKSTTEDWVYIVSNDVKRRIPSMDVIEKYALGGPIFTVPPVLLSSITDGKTWS